MPRGGAVSEMAVSRPSVGRVLLALLELTKPRIVFLVLLTGVPALLMAARGWPDMRTAFGAIVGTALAGAAESAVAYEPPAE